VLRALDLPGMPMGRIVDGTKIELPPQGAIVLV
jgi:hypothetical protein